MSKVPLLAFERWLCRGQLVTSAGAGGGAQTDTLLPPGGWYDGGLVNDLVRTGGTDEGARAAALALGAAVTEASAAIAAVAKVGSRQGSSRVRVEQKKGGLMQYSIEKDTKLPFFKL